MIENTKVRHKIGCARTIKTAIMVTEYLRKQIFTENVSYSFTNPTSENGFWLADIIITTYGDENFDKLYPNAVHVCRAFVAGAGEVWI